MFVKSGFQDLLPALFQEISVPEAVLNEVTASGKNDFPAEYLAKQQWLKKEVKIPLDLRVAAWDLGRGESEVISFALLNPSYRVVIMLIRQWLYLELKPYFGHCAPGTSGYLWLVRVYLLSEPGCNLWP